jgi:hypothetical protein
MPRFVIDWDSVQEYERLVLDPGVYPAKLETRGLPVRTTGRGNQAFQVRFHIHHQGKDVLQITRTYVLEGPGLVFTRRLVRAAGLNPVGRSQFDTDWLHDRWVRVLIRHSHREVTGDDGTVQRRTYHEIEEVLEAGNQTAPAQAVVAEPPAPAQPGDPVLEVIRKVQQQQEVPVSGGTASA